MGKVSKAKLDALVAAVGRAYGAGHDGAPVSTQQRLYSAAMLKLDKLARQYPDRDTSSSAFFDQLWQLARQWWSVKAPRGPGVDW